jgi:Zn-dependent M28 family amino/carboxypeptidase
MAAAELAAQKGAVPRSALSAITAEDLLTHIKALASDQFEGRAPGTRGEELSINYLAEQFKGAGLAPGNPDGSYFQKVPLIGITANPDAELVFSAGGRQAKLRFGDDFVAWSRRATQKAAIDAQVVFVGYGAVAPEYNWDDFKDVDVRGKVLLFLVGDPPVPDRRNPSRLDPKVFGGKAMTYYGRWTYKFEVAAEKGAAGAFIVHEAGPAGYGWDVVRSSWSVEQFDIASDRAAPLEIEGWITLDWAKELMAMAGRDFDEMKRAALSRSFKPVELNARASLALQNKIRRIESHNVIAKLEGSDLKDQYVIYVAHWDHLGIGIPDSRGDSIYNGAHDNATGTAGLIELARAFKRLRPRRSIIFLAVTAEEKGLLGSKYYAENPLYPLGKTVAAINMDGLNTYGRTRDVTVIGLGQSTLDDVLALAAARQGRRLRPDPEPEKGFYYRSDHFSFAKAGVPALFLNSGIEYIGKPPGWGLKKRQEYTRNDYHKPSDEVKPDWDLSGAVQDLQLLMEVGYRVANADEPPKWKPGSEFKAKREQMLKQSAITIPIQPWSAPFLGHRLRR